ncbi:MAG TPA: NAD(P)-dependent oxidoreductase [Candidatus Binatia bacterium]|jgi:nucleoside-diphosphate-sugar epimerase|nr:NAD(P)-dependent oxidoreductase [Candidatus Binatia bacterium]
MPSTVLITGANGFIGSHCAELMESLNHKIVPIDVVPRSPDLGLLRIETPSHIMNVTDARAFRTLCDKEKPTHIFHAAHPPRNEDPSVLDYCYHAMTNILEAAKELKLQRVVYSSSASIYGQLKKPDGSLVKEEDAVTIYPTYFYRAAKTVSEWMGDFYKEKHGVDFVALRYSSVYGPGLYRSIPLELKKGILGQPCRPFLTRPLDDLIYIDDVVDAVSRALFGGRPLSRAYNIGLDKTYVSEDLTRAIQKALPDLKFEIGQHPNAAEVAPHRMRSPLDISLAKRELGWEPKIYLDEGIAKLAAWLTEHKSDLRL